jgi:hypothetical protein
MRIDYTAFMELVDNATGANVEISPSTLALCNCLNASISSEDFRVDGAALSQEQADEIDAIIAAMFDEINGGEVIEPPGEIENFWGDEEPDYDAISDGDPGAVGLRFMSTVAGEITGIRFYRFAGSGNGQIGYLFDESHAELAEANFPPDTLGWVTAEFTTPIAIEADTPYMAVQYLPSGYVPYKINVFTSDVTVGNLTAYEDEGGVGLRNGTFCVCGAGSYPEGGFSAVNWFVDVEFVADA